MGNIEESAMGLRATLDISFGEAVEKVRFALKDQGFGVLTEVDVRETLRQKIGVEFGEYVILGVCNPVIAHGALSANPEVGLMLPCTVIVYARGGRTVVSAVDPEKALGTLNAPELAPFAAEASVHIRAAMGKVAA